MVSMLLQGKYSYRKESKLIMVGQHLEPYFNLCVLKVGCKYQHLISDTVLTFTEFRISGLLFGVLHR